MTATELPAPRTVTPAHRWAMLAVGTTAQASTAAMVVAPSFLIRAQGTSARVTAEVAQALAGEAVNVDARHVQPFLTHKLSRSVNTALAITPSDGLVELKAGGAV